MKIKLIFLWVAGCLLAGCVSQQEPMSFGMPTSQFNQLDNEQKTAAIQQYNADQIQQDNNAVLASAIGAVTNAVVKNPPTWRQTISESHNASPVQESCQTIAGGVSCHSSQSFSSSSSSVSAGIDPGGLAQTVVSLFQK